MKIRTKNVLKSIITIIIIAVVSTISGLYVGNTEAKQWIDKNVLKKIVDISEITKEDTVLIAGDIYDKIYPSAEAVALFDTFLVNLVKEDVKVFVISGNHDSPERIAFFISNPDSLHLDFMAFNTDVMSSSSS